MGNLCNQESEKQFFRDLFRLDGEGKIGSLPKQREQQGQDDADNDAGGDREIETEFLSFNDDISGQPSDPWNFFSNQ